MAFRIVTAPHSVVLYERESYDTYDEALDDAHAAIDELAARYPEEPPIRAKDVYTALPDYLDSREHLGFVSFVGQVGDPDARSFTAFIYDMSKEGK